MDETSPLIPQQESPSNAPQEPHPKPSRITHVIISMLIAAAIGTLTLHHLGQNTDFSYDRSTLLKPLTVRLYTNNIRYDNKHLDPHERSWSHRKPLITSSIQFNTFNTDQGNVVCLQEVLHNQLEDIMYGLNNDQTEGDWSYYGVGRTDGEQAGEYAPILFKHSEWIVADTKTFWLSETPEVPSRGWDAALERIVTMVTLQSKMNPLIKLNFFNTHYDHRGVMARRESSKLIVEKMKNYNNYPSFLCGDFNTQPTDEPYHILKDSGFKDSRTLVDKLHHYGFHSTFTGFNRHEEVNTIIDYIWAPYFALNGNRQPSQVETSDKNFFQFDFHRYYQIGIKNFAILHNWYDFYMSDHRPVSADYVVSLRV
ncbi:hypothetical protein PSN45_001714 [Yamadazyma tenuis]|uniref:Endonuclease/exonuclease/phosphatase domain-containing protein n=1 Tax=Candida tenuis (strain ATCC 10573 / BCRC 21748 / CBS 615 / JCM 9827 / NBRC 10315 / NRRL Y-1498 / VKM Y-70) TaxID=590646 RepID=G3BEE7_CANTC|nr:uncharacterized protein CANTEDRAFT_116595 [Yamadazyma tenuis ATCC 10573]XP_006690392.1 uncharacterized protein CANTEDRAFT_116595 [Yamadazyma tenuis ATCC 10573]EGV61177.1 hypothetical protein CANTEDRAFT_116595 [Yamadazyma tenuis ATCC 10573]EGV61178.1 hypothetical protein CANTEDRAFT_116595 [Yamadazyma tenuis ATCC 10573]WEJ94232.1 hypothetical protein PSN45_001714 [Yamadazyma tenuis]